MGIDSSTPLPQFVHNLIKATAIRLKDRHRLPESDVEDIEQGIALELVRRRAKFNRQRANEAAFYTCLVKHAAADFIAKRTASNRDFRREVASLDEWAPDGQGGWVRWSEHFTAETARRHLGQSSIPETDTCDLASDVRAVIAGLPQPLRAICRGLMHCKTIGETARTVGVHRSTVYEVLPQIRAAFALAGLGDEIPIRHFSKTAGR